MMRNVKLKLWIAVTCMTLSAVCSNAARKDEITLVMVPREDAVVQLGLDLANKYPMLLVSYMLGSNGTVSLHGWTGTQWVNVSVEDFQAGNFFRKGPDSALVVEKSGVEIPENLLPPLDWCANVSKITTVEMRPLLHLTGQYYDFSFKDWSWFAKRYNVDMDAINPEGLNVAWYHRRMEDHMKATEPQERSDLQFWVSVRQATMLEQNDESTVSELEDPVPEIEEETVGDPFTNTAPSAVIMGAADAPTEESEETDSEVLEEVK